MAELIFVQAKIKPDGHNGDIWARGLAKHGRKSACQNRVFPCQSRAKSEVNNMETDIDDMIFGDCDPGPSDR